MAERFTAPDWEREHLLAGFDRFHSRLVDWARKAPPWPPFAAAEGLIARLEPRLRVPEIDLDRALVVGFLGGSGTGKSTLFNALLGRKISRAGKEYRPMTRRAIVACHPDVDPSFLGLDDEEIEVHRLNIPLLEQMILVDCPDPDTQDPDDGAGGQRHLDILRAVLPHCDVHGAHRHLAEVQVPRGGPGAAQECAGAADPLRPDPRRDRHRQPGRPAEVPRRPGPAGCRKSSASTPWRPSPSRSAASRSTATSAGSATCSSTSWPAGRGTGSGGPTCWASTTGCWRRSRSRSPRGWRRSSRLEAAMDKERRALLGKVRARMTERIDANRRLWRSRVLRQLTQTWGAGPLAGLLGLWSAGGTLIRSLILLRARTPTQALLAGGLALSQLVGEKWRESPGGDRLGGRGRPGPDRGRPGAGPERPPRPPGRRRDRAYRSCFHLGADGDPNRDLSGEQLAAVALQVYQKLESDVSEVIEHRVARRAGRLGPHALRARLLLPARLPRLPHGPQLLLRAPVERGTRCSASTSSSRRPSGASSGAC